MTRRALAGAAATAAVLVGAWACNPDPSTIPENSPDIMECLEDEPCWDCETMGNKICGPAFVPTTAPPVTVSRGEVLGRCAELFADDLESFDRCFEAVNGS